MAVSAEKELMDEITKMVGAVEVAVQEEPVVRAVWLVLVEMELTVLE
jgi:hypothetical protein